MIILNLMNKYLVGNFYVPGTVLGSRDTSVDRKDTSLVEEKFKLWMTD